MMGLKLAVSGKGGVGKSTLAAMFAHLAVADGQRVLGIDADPESAFLTSDTDAGVGERAAGLLADLAARRVLGAGARALAGRRLSFYSGVRRLDDSILAAVAS